MFFAGVDIGATFIKSAVLDTEGCLIRDVVRSLFPGLSGTDGVREADPLSIVASVRIAIERALIAEPRCVGVLFCGQMHGLVLCDEKARPRSPFISWQDHRCQSMNIAMRLALPEGAWSATGGESQALPVARLFAMARNGSLPSGCTPASLCDFVAARLCGNNVTTDRTNAAAHGAMDVARGIWHSPTIKALGLADLAWPRIVEDCAVVGTMSVGGHHLVCYVPVGDQQAALLGALLEPGELSVNIATGSQVSRLISAPPAASAQHQLRPYPGGGFLATVTHIPAGRSLNALVRLLTELSPLSSDAAWTAISRAVAATPRTGVLADLSFFSSATGETGSISYLDEESLTVGHLFRAAYERMADDYNTFSRRLFPMRDWTRVVFSGGLVAREANLQAIVAAFLGAPCRTAPSESALHGLLVLALVASGAYATISAVRTRLKPEANEGL